MRLSFPSRPCGWPGVGTLSLLLVIAAGCGGDDGTTGATTSSAGVDDPTPTGPHRADVDVDVDIDVCRCDGRPVDCPRRGRTGRRRLPVHRGPQWLEDDGVLLFTDYSGVIYELAADDKVSVFRRPSDGANGLAVDTEGSVACRRALDPPGLTHGERRHADADRRSLRGQPVERTERHRRALRRHHLLHRSVLRGWDHDLDFHGIFRIAPDGTLTAEHRGAITEQPNGVAISPDENLLYVANEAADEVWVFDVADNGALSGSEPSSRRVPDPTAWPSMPPATSS